MSLKSDTFEGFEKSLLEYAATQYDGLADDDDPLGHCLIVGDEMTVMAIDGGMLAPDNMQELFLGVCGTIIKTKAERVGWLLSAFEVDPTKGDGGPPPPNFADDPRRVEVYQAFVVEADRAVAYKAPILRSPSRVGDWEPGPLKRNPYIEIPQRALATVARHKDELAG